MMRAYHHRFRPGASGRAASRLPGPRGGATPLSMLALLAAAAVGPGVAAAGSSSGGSPRLAASQEYQTPHSEARLVAAQTSVRPGEPFEIGLHIALDPGWHTYWRNAGDAGNGVVASWSLPAGAAVDSFAYPRPERVPYPPLLNYGYYDEVVLLTTVTPPADLEPGSTFRLAVEAEWLVCEEVCIPARDRLTLRLPVAAEGAEGAEVTRSPDAALMDRFRRELPVEAPGWAVRAARTDSGFVLAARPPDGWSGSLAGAYFFPYDPVLIEHTPTQPAGTRDGELRIRLPESPYLDGEPERVEGILTLPEGSAFDDAGSRSLRVSAPLESTEAGAVAWAREPTTPLPDPAAGAGGAAGRAGSAAAGAGAAGAGGLSLLLALAFAFVGGLILNLMPCVFPILSLKALGFASHGGDRRGMRRDGLAFGAGVVLSFLVVAGILMAVRAGGGEVGWGYQLQSPAIVALLAALMFGIGLVLAGVVDIGASLTRLGGLGQAPGPVPATGVQPAFLTGVLATVVATPCTAPFMGAAIGTALVRPPVEGLVIFAGLGVGMATPYVALSFWPALARRLPAPGRWMETFKQFLAFPMMAVAIWLVWVFGLQVGMGGAARLLFAFLLMAMAAWLVGRWPAFEVGRSTRLATRVAALALLLIAVFAGIAATRGGATTPAGAAGAVDGGTAGGSTGAGDAAGALAWEPWSQETVRAHRAAGRPVFVDFTAAWCISCQVNERVALETGPVRRAFAERDVALVKADWTRRDANITRALASFGRNGVPLYVLYPADPTAEPRVLPALLTPRIVIDALDALPGSQVQAQAGGAAAGAGS